MLTIQKLAKLTLATSHQKEIHRIESGMHLLSGIDDAYLEKLKVEYNSKYNKILSELTEAAISENVVLAQYDNALKATIV